MAKESSSEKSDSIEEIISAAAYCFMEKGYDRTTIDDIADHLGSTKGRIYHHFRSKGKIFFLVYERAMALCFDAVEPIFSSNLPTRDRLLAMCEAHALVMMEYLHFQRAIRQGVDMHLRGSTTEAERTNLTALIDLRDKYEGLFRQVLEDGIVDKTLAVPDVRIASRAILGSLNGLTDWYRPDQEGSDASRQNIAHTLSVITVDGLAIKDGGR